MEIGKLIRELRKEKGITQTELAKEISTTQDTISLWELGKSYPDIINVVKLCKFFGVTSDYLLGLNDIW
ncbi:MAG TPA: helix-turn-helix domain-containing protein [Candidatus Onthoplasma faecipullorum]|nr:helix-turn-helix domain-containing protein [Candidatus Onthoplasma faecipullorum]